MVPSNPLEPCSTVISKHKHYILQVEEMEGETKNVIAKYSEIEDRLSSVAKEKSVLESKSTKLSSKLGGVLRELQVSTQ